MTTAREIQSEVSAIFATDWKARSGRAVPATENINLGNDAVELDATVLYADLADSTELVNQFKAHFAAEIYKSYLVTACRVIRDNGGEITAFDGDRVMAVYLGDARNSNAVRSALKLNWAVAQVVNPSIKGQYPNSSYLVQHAVGIDTSHLFVARTGIRGSNDLVWVGRAANYAAKLSTIKEQGYPTIISEQVFNGLNDQSKFGGQPLRSMWEKRTWTAYGLTIYRSNWTWTID